MEATPTEGLDRNPAQGGGNAALQSEQVIRVLIVDDHPLVRQGVRWLLESQADMSVAGEADGGEQALALAGQRQVDIALMDVRMPGMGGIEATRMLRAAHPQLRVVMLTAYPECAPDAFRAGASAYVLKSARGQGLLAAIRSVYFGATVIPETLATSFTFATRTPAAPAATLFSPREIQVLHLIARGLTNRAIARELGIGPRTADQHVHSIFIKAGVRSRTGAVRYALEHHLAESEATSQAN